MNPETLEALQASIEHWERLATGKRQPGEGCSSKDCSLCDAFFVNGCVGCPVKEWRGLPNCRGTPYWSAHDRHLMFGIDSPEFLTAAAAELAFLKSLLPKEEEA